MEKHRAIQSQIHSVIINQDEITDQDEINKQIFSFYQYLFSRKVQKNELLFLISSNQMVYVKNRFISESGRVVSDNLEISKTLALKGFLLAVDI